MLSVIGFVFRALGSSSDTCLKSNAESRSTSRITGQTVSEMNSLANSDNTTPLTCLQD